MFEVNCKRSIPLPSVLSQKLYPPCEEIFAECSKKCSGLHSLTKSVGSGTCAGENRDGLLHVILNSMLVGHDILLLCHYSPDRI